MSTVTPWFTAAGRHWNSWLATASAVTDIAGAAVLVAVGALRAVGHLDHQLEDFLVDDRAELGQPVREPGVVAHRAEDIGNGVGVGKLPDVDDLRQPSDSRRPGADKAPSLV